MHKLRNSKFCTLQSRFSQSSPLDSCNTRLERRGRESRASRCHQCHPTPGIRAGSARAPECDLRPLPLARPSLGRLAGATSALFSSAAPTCLQHGSAPVCLQPPGPLGSSLGARAGRGSDHRGPRPAPFRYGGYGVTTTCSARTIATPILRPASTAVVEQRFLALHLAVVGIRHSKTPMLVLAQKKK